MCREYFLGTQQHPSVLKNRLWTELHLDTFHWGPSLWAMAGGCGLGTGEGRRVMWARWCQRLLEPGGGQGLCPKWALDQLLLEMGVVLACPSWGCPLPSLPRQGPLRSPATFSLSSLGCEVSWFHAPPAPGLTALLVGTLGWGISQPDAICLISFSLSGGERMTASFSEGP